jgi:hypothetical protein
MICFNQRRYTAGLPAVGAYFNSDIFALELVIIKALEPSFQAAAITTRIVFALVRPYPFGFHGSSSLDFDDLGGSLWRFEYTQSTNTMLTIQQITITATRTDVSIVDQPE